MSAPVVRVELIYLKRYGMVLQALDATGRVTPVGNEYGLINRAAPDAFVAAELEAKAEAWAKACGVSLKVSRW